MYKRLVGSLDSKIKNGKKFVFYINCWHEVAKDSLGEYFRRDMHGEKIYL